MNNQFFTKTIFFLLAIFFISSLSHADIPELINYQGILKNTAGAPAPSDQYGMVFAIWDQAAGGNQLWEEEHKDNTDSGGVDNSVTVVDGHFSILLGALAPFDDTVFSSADTFIGIKVIKDGYPESELVPRQRFVSVGYAFSAKNAENATNADSANYATSAGNAITADNATDAGYADSAGSASSANYANSAGSASKLSGDLNVDGWSAYCIFKDNWDRYTAIVA